jgi:hypothetical protein
MRLHRNSQALSTGMQRPLDDSSIEAATSQAGRTVALIVTVLAILMLVAL